MNNHLVSSSIIVLCFLIHFNNGSPTSEKMKSRGLRGPRILGAGETTTKLFIENLVVTSVVPSSCVVVSTDLVPCRNYRMLWGYFYPTTVQDNVIPTISVANIQAKAVDEPLQNINQNIDHQPTPQLPYNNEQFPKTEVEQGLIPVEPVEPGWGDYFNFFGTTITKVATRLLTETVVDKARTVTFSIKHCRPSKMPFDLPECPSKSEIIKENPISSSVSHHQVDLEIENQNQIQPTRPANLAIQQTQVPQMVGESSVNPNRRTSEDLLNNHNLTAREGNAVLSDLLLNIQSQNISRSNRIEGNPESQVKKLDLMPASEGELQPSEGA